MLDDKNDGYICSVDSTNPSIIKEQSTSIMSHFNSAYLHSAKCTEHDRSFLRACNSQPMEAIAALQPADSSAEPSDRETTNGNETPTWMMWMILLAYAVMFARYAYETAYY